MPRRNLSPSARLRDPARRASDGRGTTGTPRLALLGAAAAAWFTGWFLFLPRFVPDYFAWAIEPRFAQAFIGAGYQVRTAFVSTPHDGRAPAGLAPENARFVLTYALPSLSAEP